MTYGRIPQELVLELLVRMLHLELSGARSLNLDIALKFAHSIEL
jgi:hypothetical protein